MDYWKLIKLLNEYETDKLRKDMRVNWADEKRIDLAEAKKREDYEVEEYLEKLKNLKEFIKRLVKNNKIEWSEKTAFVTFLEREINADKSDALVSLLAVKDNPIEYICGILK